MIIDVHAHHIDEIFFDALRSLPGVTVKTNPDRFSYLLKDGKTWLPFRPEKFDPDHLIHEMDRKGIDVSILSMNTPSVYIFEPRQRIDLLNNLPFAVGAAIRFGDVPLRLYLDPALADDVVLTAVPKVRWIDLGRGVGTAVTEPGQVRIVTVDGTRHEAICDVPLGGPTRPMSAAQQRGKFLDCAANASRPLEPERAEAIVETVMGLETLADVSSLMRLLT